MSESDHLNNEFVAKIELGMLPDRSLEEMPPFVDFSINWATHEEWAHVLDRCVLEKRQTMNLRKSKSAKLIILRDDETWNICGWAGLDFDRIPEYPELFSCFLEPNYRNYLLWLAMTHARCQIALEHEIEILFTRIFDAPSNLFSGAKLETPVFKFLLPESIDPDFRNLCRDCELFGNSCRRQGFVSLDVAKMLQHVQVRFGFLPPCFPARFTLDREKMRNLARTDRKLNLEWKKD